MSLFIDACYCRPTDYTPVWIMRQAGRYQPTYRAIRQKTSFLELCKTPELAAKVTVQAVEELGVDAGIIFSDILIPLEAMGAPFMLSEKGPVIANPIRSKAAVDALVVPDPVESAPYVLEAIRLARHALPEQVPLIGFAGAPITLASYLVEGKTSKDFPHLRALLFGEPNMAHVLLDKLAQVVSAHLRAQVAAGCQAIQIFDSWGGILGPLDYQVYGLPYLQRIMNDLADLKVPRILFAIGSATLLESMKLTGAEVIGIDWRLDLSQARQRLGPDLAIQGNLDPGCLFLDEKELEQRIRLVLDQAGSAPGHIFNLGHGILPQTQPERARFMVDTVHRLSRRSR